MLQRAFHPSLTSLFVCTVGIVGLSSTDFSAKGQSLIGGSYQRAIEADFGDKMPLREASIHAWTAAKLAVFGQTDASVITGADGWLFTDEEFRRAEQEFNFEVELENAMTQLATHNITLIPVIVPDKARVYDHLLPHDRLADIEVRYAEVQSLLASYNLPTIDLAAVLRDNRQTEETFMRTDTHWSPFGAETAAKVIATEMSGLTVAPAEFVTTFGKIEPFEGDLLNFIQTGPFTNLVGPDAEFIKVAETVNTAGADLLFGDATIPMALIGTSYSARDEFNFAGFLRQHTGLDLINYSTLGQGPFAPMQAFLASNAIQSSPPTIVIWELPERYISVKAFQ
jgi:alginate O-acetyltransferase complex protein AlgJ